jgi:hypothetical protein
MLEEIIVFAVCALGGLGCLGVVAATALSPETVNVDKLFAIIASLVVGLAFFSIAGWMLFNTRLRKLWRSEPATAAGVTKSAAAPAPQMAQQAGKV